MRILKIVFKRETIAPMLALVFASAVCVTLVMGRVAWTWERRYAFLIWNLFLAWLPLVFAMLACEASRQSELRKNWRLLGLTGAWLLFFPNAPYIFTDLIHLTSEYQTSHHYWMDMMLILLCALTGLVLGFVSLYLMQSVVTRLYGRVLGWFFVATAAGLCSVGIYLGRFLRFNSWDVLLHPGKIYRGLDSWADHRLAHGSSLAFLVLFATFMFIAYVMLYALTHLPSAQQMVLSEENQKLRKA